MHISDNDYKIGETAWHLEQMHTFRDFLMWYNNLDVQPFVMAVEKLQTFYLGKHIDIFKTAISVPGIARQMLFKGAREERAEFFLIDEKNKDL